MFTQLQNKFGTSNLSNKLPVDDCSYEVYFKERYYMLCTPREIEIEQSLCYSINKESFSFGRISKNFMKSKYFK